MKMLARNTPIALICGAAGFLGSHLCEKLLTKNVQVVGIDNFSSGRQENLIEASKDKNFYFLTQPAVQKLPVELPRLDYAFFMISDDLTVCQYLASLENFLSECRDFKPKIVLCSSLDLYDSRESTHGGLREAEKRLAKYALENSINARVVRLATVYGPRMNFSKNEPVSRLVRAAIKNELQKEIDALDFTTRSLFVDDVVNLLIKTVMHGATAQKIYDGALLYPVKVSEVKQVLLDPLWHENRGFAPTELPPWPSPNLEKTMNELSWKPKVLLVQGLRETLRFFKENPQLLKETDIAFEPAKTESEEGSDKSEQNKEENKEKTADRKKIHLPNVSSKLRQKYTGYLLTGLGLVVIIYALILPAISLGLLTFRLNQYLRTSSENLSLGNLTAAGVEANLAKKGVENLQQTLNFFDSINQLGIGRVQLQNLSELVQISNEAVQAVEHGAVAAEAVSVGLKSISGEQEGNGEAYFNKAQEELQATNHLLGLIVAKLSDSNFQNSWPSLIKDRILDWQKQAVFYQQTAKYGQNLTYLLGQLVSVSGKKEYLVLWQDNFTLRPGGGVDIALAHLVFTDGKLTDISTDSVASLDRDRKEQVKLSDELAKDLNQNALLLKDVSFEADGPVNGKTSAWFYNHDKGTNPDAVLFVDTTAAEKLLSLLGPVTVEGGGVVNGQNVADKIAGSADPGKLSAAVLKELLQRLFFLSNQNWLDLADTIGQGFDGKHLLVYLSDPAGLSYFKSEGWIGMMPRQAKEGTGERKEFLAASESNIGTSGSNKNLIRSYTLEDSVNLSGEVNHKLTIKYALGIGEAYRFRLKVYLAGGSKLGGASFGRENILSSVGSFSDFGRSGYSMLLSLQSGESKDLVLEYSDSNPVVFVSNKLKYQMDFIKQPGTSSDSLKYKIAYPFEFKALGQKLSDNPLVFSTDLSQDRQYSVTFQK